MLRKRNERKLEYLRRNINNTDIYSSLTNSVLISWIYLHKKLSHRIRRKARYNHVVREIRSREK